VTILSLAQGLTLAQGWRPFLDPVNAHPVWYLFILPISFFIAVAYKAVRVKTFTGYWQSVLVMTVQIIAGMLALAAAFYVLVQVYPNMF